jgi:hypothetical protein
MLRGFYSIQALSTNDAYPSITQYHRTPEPALKWMTAMAKRKLFDAFALSSSGSRWDVFDSHGKKIETRKSILPEEGLIKDLCEPMQGDLTDYIQSVEEILGDSVCSLSFAVHHASASSVGISNTMVVARDMIMNASDEDLEHVYFADGIVNECRVQSWFMDADAVSEELMDQYLDRYQWLTKGWPLDNDHHMLILGNRMATLRPWQVFSILQIVGEHADLGESPEEVGQRLLPPPPEELIMFTSLMLYGLKEGLLLAGPYDLESFDQEVVIKHAESIAGMYRDIFLL